VGWPPVGSARASAGGTLRGLSIIVACCACLLGPVACTIMPTARVVAARPCGTCAEACAHEGPQLHVATTGDDRNPGTEGAPWRTIQRAMNAATAGATVHIAEGTYAERLAVNVSGTPGGCISFQPRGFVVPAGGCGGYTGVACGGDQVVVDLAPFGNPVADGVPLLAIDGRSHLRIQGLVFQDYTTSGPLQQGVSISGGSSDVEILRNRFLRLKTAGAHDPSNALLTFWVRHPASSVTVSGNEIGEIVSGYGEALTTAADDVLIENNWIHDTDGIGIENRDEWSQSLELSSAFATPLRISTTARRAVQTLIGSNDAFRTSTREFILKRKYNLAPTILSKLGCEKADPVRRAWSSAFRLSSLLAPSRQARA